MKAFESAWREENGVKRNIQIRKKIKSTKGVQRSSSLILTQNHSFRIFHTPEEVVGDQVKKAKFKRDDHALIAPILKDGNHLVDNILFRSLSH